MKKIIGGILAVTGLAGTAYFAIQASKQQSDIDLLGMDITVSEANWTPVIISGAVMLIGVVLLLIKGK